MNNSKNQTDYQLAKQAWPLTAYLNKFKYVLILGKARKSKVIQSSITVH